ncbi:unnamed protein product, partial [Rotaria magnacalcarata]
DHKNSHRIYKRRSVSAATATATTYISINDKNSRTARTNSSSAVSVRSKSSTNITNPKRSHSPHSMTLMGSNKSPGQRKKQKISHYWALFGKCEQKLVSIDADKPPTYRECYSSIRHVKEKDIINSDDCVLLRPENAEHNGMTP